MNFGLSGKRALVFGAGSGLGKATALALAAEGAVVVAAGRTLQKVETTAREIAQAGGIAYALQWDVTEISSVADRLAQAEAAAGGAFGVLFNNGGGPAPSLAHGQPLATWQAQFENLVLSVITITDHVLPGMKAAGWGRILTNASAGVVSPLPNLAMSNTLRSALVGWSKTLSTEVARHGITVNMVLPGRIASDRTRAIDENRSKQQGIALEEVERQSKALIPMGRYGDLKEYGAVVAFLASEQASYVTGTMMRVDGGLIPSV
ncbi:MAG: SDR family oxidoreductase [Burkholderiaceae bacterium]